MATTRNPQIYKQLVAVKPPQPSVKGSWVRHREHCNTWVRFEFSLHVVTRFCIYQCCHQLMQLGNFAQPVSALNQS